MKRNLESSARRYRFDFIAVTECDGLRLKDVAGRTYLDFTSGGQTSNLGHKPPEVIAAVQEQIARTGLTSLGWVLNDTRIRLAEKLKEISPGALSRGRVGYCNTGADATELSLRLARQFTGRSMVICSFGCFHGHTSLGSLSMNACPQGRSYDTMQIPGVMYVPFPYCYRCLFNQKVSSCGFECLRFVEYQFETKVIPPDRVAAFFIEPIQVHGGIVPLPDGYARELARICHENGILLVIDEVTTGFGRTGKMFGIQNWDVEVDILYMAKSVAAGLSLGAIVAGEEIMANFKGGGSFSGNPVACAASLANIDVIEKRDLLSQARRQGEHLSRRLAELSENHQIIGDVRGLGLLAGVELVEDARTKKPATKATETIVRAAAREGLLMFPGGAYDNVLRLCPPLIATTEDIDEAMSILDRVLP